jgi:hypothetical protein
MSNLLLALTGVFCFVEGFTPSDATDLVDENRGWPNNRKRVEGAKGNAFEVTREGARMNNEAIGEMNDLVADGIL